MIQRAGYVSFIEEHFSKQVRGAVRSLRGGASDFDSSLPCSEGVTFGIHNSAIAVPGDRMHGVFANFFALRSF
jgi:hypothetical protein